MSEAKGILTKLNPKQITLDSQCQSRVKMNDAVIAEYEEIYRDPERRKRMPPPIVWHRPGKPWYPSDGFHRIVGAIRAGVTDLECDVRSGDLRDAILHSFGVNDDHGLRRTNDDKRRAVNAMLTDEEWSKWSDRKIADMAKVHHTFVGKVREAMRIAAGPLTGAGTSQNGETRTYVHNKSGQPTEMKVGNINKDRKKPDAEETPDGTTAEAKPAATDADGSPIPDKALKLHAQNAVMQAIARDISEIKKRVKALDSTHFLEQQIVGGLEAARSALVAYQVTHVCPACKGAEDVCRMCANTGIVTKLKAESWGKGQ